MVYWFDILVFGITLLLGLKGIINGLVKEFFGLLGIVGGVLLASRLAKNASDFINSNIHNLQNDELGQFIGFLCVLIVFWLVCLCLGFVLSKLISMSGLGFLDRLGGFAFACVKIFLIFAILLFCLSEFSFLKEKLDKFTKESFIVPVLEKTGAFIMNDKLIKKVVQETGENLIIDTNATNLNEGE